MNLDTVFPPKLKAAAADVRYVHRYNYSTQYQGWILIAEAQAIFGVNHWSFFLVDPVYGAPIGDIKKSTADLWSDRFADRPFPIDEPVEDQYVWFQRIARPFYTTQKDLDNLFAAYRERLAYCSSYEALRRIGIAPDFEAVQADGQANPMQFVTHPHAEGQQQ